MGEFTYQYLENMSWDIETLNLVAKIHEYKGRQDIYIRQKPIELERLVDIAKIQSTEASNKIEGIVTTDTRMKQLFNEQVQPRNRDEGEIIGYRDVLNIIHDSYAYIPIKSMYILQLHKVLLKKSGLSYGGKFKNVQNYINETREDGSVITKFTPVAPHLTSSTIEKICLAYHEAVSLEKIDSLILIPAFIGDFLCVHPFNDGNGRMSRLLTLLLLYQSGFEVGKYISIEKEIEKTKDQYYQSLEALDINWYEGTNNPVPFIKYMLKIILACYVEFEARVEIMEVTGHKSSAYDVVKKYVDETFGAFTSAEVLVHCPSVGRSSAIAALKKLQEEGLIVKKGAGRSTVYFKADINR